MGAANTTNQKIRLQGDKELLRGLKIFRQRVQTKLQKQALNAGGTIILQAARRLVPRRTGQLRRSLGKKGKAYRRQGVYVVVIGPRRGFKTMVDGKPVNPVKYAHLVEFGTRHSKPKPFMRPALDENKAAALAAIEGNLRKGIDREAAKAKTK